MPPTADDKNRLPKGMAEAITAFHNASVDEQAEMLRALDGRESGAVQVDQIPDPDRPTPVTRVLVWDHRVSVVGHSANSAVCVAISSAVQTAAAIARAQGLAERVELTSPGQDPPVYEIVLHEGIHSRQIISGLMASFAGIARTGEAKTGPGTAMLVSDMRRDIPEPVRFAEEAAQQAEPKPSPLITGAGPRLITASA